MLGGSWLAERHQERKYGTGTVKRRMIDDPALTASVSRGYKAGGF
jgi:hypothetical protein